MRIVNMFYRVERNKLFIYKVFQKDGKKEYDKFEANYDPYFYTKEEIESPLVTKTEIVEAENGKFFRNYVSLPFSVRTIRDALDVKKIETFEADIPYSIRYFIDNVDDIGDEDLTIAYFDIESSNPPFRFVDFNVDKIKSIAFTAGEVEKCFHIDDFRNERELIMKFFEEVLNYSVLVGWNTQFFDLPYLYKRCIINRVPLKILQYFVFLDLMNLYKRFVTSYSKQQIVTSFSLDNVSFIELGEKKFDKKVLFGGTKEEVVKYNIRDCRLVEKIDEKLKLTKLIDSFSRISKLMIGDCTNFSRIITFIIMKRLNKKYVFNNSNYGAENDDVGYLGALVLDPPTGIIENVAVFDFSAMYPNIIIDYNISIDKNGTYPQIVKEFMILRGKYKKLLAETGNETYNVLQIGSKFLLASFYGVLGFPRSRIFNKDLAEKITTTGRSLLKGIASFSSSRGYPAIYGDTDSIMIQIPIEKCRDFKDEINDYLIKNFGVKNLLVNFEKFFSKVYFYGVKKRYFGRIVLDENFEETDKFFSRGMEIRRTDWCKLATEYQETLLKLMLDNVSNAYSFHKKTMKSIDKQPIEKFVIYKSLTKKISEYKVKPPHVRLATSQTFVGEKIGYIVTGYRNKRITNVDKPENVKKIGDIAIDYYKDRQINAIYKRILEPLLQTSLSDFF